MRNRDPRGQRRDRDEIPRRGGSVARNTIDVTRKAHPGAPLRTRAARDEVERERAEQNMDRAFMSRRKFVGGAFGAGFFIAAGMYTKHAFIDGPFNLRQLAARNLYDITSYARRGTMYDRNGKVLVTSVDAYNVILNASQVDNPSLVARVLTDNLGLDSTEILTYCKDKESQYRIVAREIDASDKEALEAERDDKGKAVSGIEFKPLTKRSYPSGNLASQVTGVVGYSGDDTEKSGITGLELEYEDILAGKNGTLVREHGRNGELIAGGTYEKVAAVDGTDVILTIDADIQKAAEEAMATAVAESGAKYGSAIVVDPRNGEILAACSYPTYSQEDLEHARTEDMNLRPVTDSYEPGSVFKTFVAGAAIDLGLITADTEFTVPASILVGSDTVSDADGRTETMVMTTREILRRSSNVGMVLVAEKLGADNLAKYLEAFGFGSKTGIDFPGEVSGMVRERDKYDGSSLGSMAFGQGIALPPVQVLRAATGLANGGIMSVPHFVASKGGVEIDWSSKQQRCLTKEAADAVVDMMVTVVEEGTGQGAAIEGVTIAGKTGTAERAGADGGYEEGNNMASFLGFTSPKDPRAMVYVTLDGTANTSSYALPPFKTIMEACVRSLDIPRGAQ